VNSQPEQAIPIGGGIPTYYVFSPTIGTIQSGTVTAQAIRVDDNERFSGITIYVRTPDQSGSLKLRAAIYPISRATTGPRVGGPDFPLLAQTQEVSVPTSIPRDYTPLFLPFTSKPNLSYHGAYFLLIQANTFMSGVFFEYVQPGILVSTPGDNQVVVFQNQTSGWALTGDPNASGAGSMCADNTYGPFPPTPPIFRACGSSGLYMILTK
jgi:hypothetical protein